MANREQHGNKEPKKPKKKKEAAPAVGSSANKGPAITVVKKKG